MAYFLYLTKFTQSTRFFLKMMHQLIEIHWTSCSIEEARTISQALIKQKYVACAQLIPHIESIYYWNGAIETSQESKVYLKSLRCHYETIKSFIEKNGTYQVPEIIYFSMDGGNPAYLKWLEDYLLPSSSN